MTNAIAVYRAQVTNPALWEPGFIAALVASLGKKFALAFGAPPEEIKEASAEQIASAKLGAMERG